MFVRLADRPLSIAQCLAHLAGRLVGRRGFPASYCSHLPRRCECVEAPHTFEHTR